MTTTIDASLSVRGAVIAAFKADAALTALVPAGRIYPSKTPANVAWPFIKLGVLMNSPTRYDCGGGGDVTGAVHVFVKGSASILDPEARTYQINKEIVRVLDGIDIVLADDLSLGFTVTLSQVMEDGAEADAYHGVVSIVASAT